MTPREFACSGGLLIMLMSRNAAIIYIESPGGLLVMRMTEDERYYHTADCEQVLLETADSIRRK